MTFNSTSPTSAATAPQPSCFTQSRPISDREAGLQQLLLWLGQVDAQTAHSAQGDLAALAVGTPPHDMQGEPDLAIAEHGVDPRLAGAARTLADADGATRESLLWIGALIANGLAHAVPQQAEGGFTEAFWQRFNARIEVLAQSLPSSFADTLRQRTADVRPDLHLECDQHGLRLRTLTRTILERPWKEKTRWIDLPPEMQGEVISHLGARDLASLATTCRASSALPSQSWALARLGRNEATHMLHNHVRLEHHEQVRALASPALNRHIDWTRHYAGGGPLVITAWAQASRPMVEALLHAPHHAFAILDSHGNNVLHYAVRRGDAELVRDALAACPLLHVLIDRPGFLGRTPLAEAYDTRHDGMIEALTAFTFDELEETTRNDPNFNAFTRQAPVALPPAAQNEGLAAQIAQALAHEMAQDLGEQMAQQVVGGLLEGLQQADDVAVPNEWNWGNARQARLSLIVRAASDGEAIAMDHFMRSLPDGWESYASRRQDLLVAALPNDRPTAMAKTQWSIVRRICRALGEPHAYSRLNNRESILSLAAKCGDPVIMRWLLQQSLPAEALTVRDASGRTPLLLAAQRGYAHCVEIMIRTPNIASLDEVDARNDGVLFLMVTSDHVFAAVSLLDRNRNAPFTRADCTHALVDCVNMIYSYALDDDSEGLFDVLRMIGALLSLPTDKIDLESRYRFESVQAELTVSEMLQDMGLEHYLQSLDGHDIELMPLLEHIRRQAQRHLASAARASSSSTAEEAGSPSQD